MCRWSLHRHIASLFNVKSQNVILLALLQCRVEMDDKNRLFISELTSNGFRVRSLGCITNSLIYTVSVCFCFWDKCQGLFKALYAHISCEYAFINLYCLLCIFCKWAESMDSQQQFDDHVSR